MPRITVYVTHRRHVEDAVKDRYGNATEGYVEEPKPLGLYQLAPRTSTEPTEDGRRPVITGAVAYAPHGTDVKHRDQLVGPDGTVWDVDGKPGVWGPRSASSAATGVITRGGVEINLTESEG